jgi:hypothetical protein
MALVKAAKAGRGSAWPLVPAGAEVWHCTLSAPLVPMAGTAVDANGSCLNWLLSAEWDFSHCNKMRS